MKKIFFLSISILFSISLLNATSEKAKEAYKFWTLSPEGGFYYDGVLSIQQDNEGFIWIAMKNDIYRFDGYEYKRYFPAFKEIDPSRNWIFRNLASDSKGRLFVSTDNGLYIYNKLLDSFEELLDSKISFVKIDNKDNIWISYTDGTFFLFDLKTKSLTQPSCNEKPVTSIRTICANNKNMFAVSYNLIYYNNYGQLNFEVLYTFPKDYEIVDIKENKGKLWVLVRNIGLFKINIATREIEQQFNIFSQINERLRNIHVDKNGLVWITALNGLYTLDTKDNSYKKYLYDISDPF